MLEASFWNRLPVLSSSMSCAPSVRVKVPAFSKVEAFWKYTYVNQPLTVSVVVARLPWFTRW